LGVGDMPAWVADIEYAKDFGIRPQEVEDEPVIWFVRWAAYRSEVNRAADHKRKHGK